MENRKYAHAKDDENDRRRPKEKGRHAGEEKTLMRRRRWYEGGNCPVEAITTASGASSVRPLRGCAWTSSAACQSAKRYAHPAMDRLPFILGFRVLCGR